MRFQSRQAPVVAVIAALAGCTHAADTAPREETSEEPPALFERLPLAFESNFGQVDPQVAFVARGPGYDVFLTSEETVLSLAPVSPGAPPSAIRLAFIGGDPSAPLVPLESLPGKSHYLRGADPGSWITDVPQFARIRRGDVYPGIDVIYYGAREGLVEFDLEVAPGFDAGIIGLSIEGADAIEIDDGGDLLIETPAGRLVQHAPKVYQEASGVRRQVEGRYSLGVDGGVSLRLGDRDPALPLVIDPVLSFQTLIGGSQVDNPIDIAVDSRGASFVCGLTTSFDFPNTTGPSYRGGSSDAFVIKLHPSGTALEYSTFLGGFDQDLCFAIAVAEGRAYVAGHTVSYDFPVVGGTETLHNSVDSFIAQLTTSGSALVYSRLFGGARDDRAVELVLDAAGRAHVAGTTTSLDLPTTANAFQGTLRGGEDAFVATLSNAGDTYLYASYFGGSGNDLGRGLDVNALGERTLSGQTSSLDFPIANAFQSSRNGSNDGFVARIAASGTALLFSSYLGGSGSETAISLGVDGLGATYATGITTSVDFPASPGAFQIAFKGTSDSFLTKLDAAGTILWSTFFGGSAVDSADAILVDSAGNARITGLTTSTDLPMIQAVQSTHGGGSDAFVAKFRSDGALEYSTFLGDSLFQRGTGIATDGVDDYVSGSSSPGDVFIAKISQFETTITSGPPSITNVNIATFTFTASEAGSTFVCSLDGSAFQLCDSGLSTPPLAEGRHQFEVQATSPSGRLDPTPAYRSWTVDTVAPDTMILFSAPDGAQVSWYFTSTELGATFQCRVDTGAFASCFSPFQSEPLADGDHTFFVRAMDAVNVDPTPASQTFNVDTVAPETTITSGPPAATNGTSVTFTFTSNDPDAKFECRLMSPANPFRPCESPVSFGPPLTEEEHRFEVRAFDQAGNYETTPAIHTFLVDRSAPVLVLVSPLDGASVQTSPVTVTISASEPAFVTASSLFSAGTVLPAGTSSMSVSLQDGHNTFSTFARDDAGNSSLFTFHLFLDATPPTLVFLSPENASSTYHSPIDVLVSVSEDVTIVTSSPGFLSPIGGLLAGGERTLRLSLSSGLNEFSATLRDGAGNETAYVGPSAFSLTLTTERPPAPLISAPVADTVFSERVASVAGTASGNAVRVQITGASTVSVPVTAGAWSGTVTLAEGASRIRAVAFSAAGGASPETSVPVSAGGTARIAIESGNEQLGPTGATLALPLAARVTDLSGAPLAGVSVTFSLDVEPVTLDGNLGGTGKTATALTDRAGRASVPLTLATSHVNLQGVMQPTLVTATVPGLAGTRAVFAAQGLPVASFGGTGTPTYLIPIGRDCTTTPDRPVGSCPLGPAGSVVSGFTVAVLDETYRLLPDAGVDFTAVRGTFGASPTIHLQTGPDGMARSGVFTLSQTIPNPEGLFVMLRPDDLAATPVQIHDVTAALSALPSAQMSFVAYAHAGPAAAIVDVSTSTVGGWPGIPIRDALTGRVEDAFGNPLANASLTFAVVPLDPADPDDPGAKLFRSDTTASSASQCAFVLSKNDDDCTTAALSATTFSAGTAWAHLTMGLRGDTPYQVTASAGGAPPLTFTRRSRFVGGTQFESSWLILQASATAAARFAILQTENDDTDPLTAVTWASTCWRIPAGTPVGKSVCVSTTREVRRITVDAQGTSDPSGSPHFFPSFWDGIGEGHFRLVGGKFEEALNLVASITYFGQTRSVAFAGAQKPPSVTIDIESVSLECAEDPALPLSHLCGTTPKTTGCRKASPGLDTYVDLKNHATENNVLVIKVLHPPASPLNGRLVGKYSQTVGGFAPTASGVDYFAEVTGAIGIPGIYNIENTKRLGPAANSDTLIDFSPGMKGCEALIAKSFKRTSDPFLPSPPAPAVTAPPPDVQLEVKLPDGTVVGGPKTLPGWVDRIKRQRNDPRIGTIGAGNCTLPAPNCDGVADWVQMRAWDYYTRNVPAGGISEVDDNNMSPPTPVIQSGEPLEIFNAVQTVQSVFLPLGQPLPTGDYTALTAGTRANPGGAHNTWTMTTTITFNMLIPTLRTDGEAKKIYSEFPADLYGTEYQATRAFRNTAFHEARHAWQFSLLIKSSSALAGSPQFIPSTIAAPANNELGGANTLPDNNDDTDCLPEKAFLSSGVGVDIGVPFTRSAFEIVDRYCTPAQTLAGTCPNREFTTNIQGDGPGDGPGPVFVDVCGSATATSFGQQALERDASRFARTLAP